jgi:hypothetical protein
LWTTDGVEDCSSVSLIQLEEKTVEQARRDISTDSEKDCAGCEEAACCFV